SPISVTPLLHHFLSSHLRRRIHPRRSGGALLLPQPDACHGEPGRGPAAVDERYTRPDGHPGHPLRLILFLPPLAATQFDGHPMLSSKLGRGFAISVYQWPRHQQHAQCGSVHPVRLQSYCSYTNPVEKGRFTSRDDLTPGASRWLQRHSFREGGGRADLGIWL
ncbi:unnamed protein product, partial [Urochloa humidicola]